MYYQGHRPPVSPADQPSSDHTVVPSSPIRRPLPLNLGNSCQSMKRRKLTPELYEVTAEPVATNTWQKEEPKEYIQLPSTTALLYHYAQQAHRASISHLQQAFVPTSIALDKKAGYPLIKFYRPQLFQEASAPQSDRYFHDPQAATKAIGLQLFALDLLRAGLGTNELSDRERVAFSLEFGVIGIKVYTTWQESRGKRRRGGESADGLKVICLRLMDEMQDIIGQAFFLAQRQSSLTSMRLKLELLNMRLAFIQGKFNLGKRMAQTALAGCKDDPSHRYTLYLTHLEYIESTGPTDFINLVDDLLRESRKNNHTKITQLACLIKARMTFVHRRWELVPAALTNLASSIGWSDDPPPSGSHLGQGDVCPWMASLTIHYLLLRSLWEGRVGNDTVAKSTMKVVYALMDETADKNVFGSLRASGGVMAVSVGDYQPLQIQLTPPNILYMLTYLTTVVSRRDFTGSNATCKSIVHPKVLRETENLARAEDMWDIGFTSFHGMANVAELQKEVMAIRGEIMIEQASALIYRSCFQEGLDLLYKTVDHLHSHDLFHLISPHICLIFAQHCHHLGLTQAAVRYYTACKNLINSGSELSLIADIGILASGNRLEDLEKNMKEHDQVNALAEKCKGSNSAMLNASGYFLASLTDGNRVNSKKKLSTAYEISQKSNNNILRLLIFAFTTSTHHYGGRERMLRQLETGREISKMVGGKDRQDGVGQVILGLWFARRLKEFWRQEGHQQGAQAAKEIEQLHRIRLNEVRALTVSPVSKDK